MRRNLVIQFGIVLLLAAVPASAQTQFSSAIQPSAPRPASGAIAPGKLLPAGFPSSSVYAGKDAYRKSRPTSYELARLNPGLAWQRVRYSGPVGRDNLDGPILYQIIFRSSATPGSIPKIAGNFTLTNSLITEGNGFIAIGGMSISGGTGIITFANGQTFPGISNLAGEVTGPPAANVVSNAVSTNTANAIVRRDGSGSLSAGTVTLAGNLALPNTASASVGVLTLGGMRFLHNFGTNNTFVGQLAGNLTMTGSANSAVGSQALFSNTTGNDNAAFGSASLENNITGGNNSAFGTEALESNSTGSYDAAFGFDALVSNTTGFNNAAFGSNALQNNTTGTNNSAFGTGALQLTTGDGNTGNTAVGFNALQILVSGKLNSAFGTSALAQLASGDFNVAIGFDSGHSFTGAESNNIDISNVGVAGDSNTIRIGNDIHRATFIAGISGVTSASGVAVLINSSGQLGTVLSSQRYKQQIADLGSESDVLMKLRPVAFYYKPELDSTHTRQYGLVAEEVAQVAPDLVVFDEKGAPQTVRYHFVNAMLLNEVQKQRRMIEVQQQQIEHLNAVLESQQAAQQVQITALREELRALRDLLQKSAASSLAQLARDGK